MRNPIPAELLAILFVFFFFHSCKDDSYLTTIPPVPDQSFTEEFDTATAALSRGWKFINTSEALGSSVWQNGGSIPPFFNAYSNNGSYVGFIGTDRLSTSAAKGVISNWLVSPLLIIQNDDKIVFYTKALQYPNGSGDTTDYGNSLQLRINTNDTGLNVGTGINPGNFTKVLIAINPLLTFSSVLSPDPAAYPSQWTRFEATISGLNSPAKGRFAFRYFIIDGGTGGYGSGVGIDAVSYKSAGY